MTQRFDPAVVCACVCRPSVRSVCPSTNAGSTLQSSNATSGRRRRSWTQRRHGVRRTSAGVTARPRRHSWRRCRRRYGQRAAPLSASLPSSSTPPGASTPLQPQLDNRSALQAFSWEDPLCSCEDSLYEDALCEDTFTCEDAQD
eukprot:364337-Chlamydomonas_euryale.AAC.11